MKTNPVTPADLARSVLAVPPLARRSDGGIDEDQNRRLLAHLRSGGVHTFIYGGNADLYNMGVREHALFCDMLERWAEEDDWIIPSVGSDFGKALDQVRTLRGFRFPTVMLLPHRFPATCAGAATGLRRLADAFGRPLIAYVKHDGQIDAADLARLTADGVVAAIKYAIVRPDPKIDPFLEAVLAGIDRAFVVSGMGERPAIDHLRHFGLAGFTSGSVCIAPRLATALLEHVRSGDLVAAERLRRLFLPLEDLRDRHSPIRVLHEAVRLCGVAETGPMSPFLSNITDPAVLAAIEREAAQLLKANETAPAQAT